MGFSLQLLLVVSRKIPIRPYDKPSRRKTYTLWEPEVIIDVNHVSAPARPSELMQLGVRRRAALYFTEYIWRSLDTAVRVQGKRCFAPQFAICKKKRDDNFPSFMDWEDDLRQHGSEESQFIRAYSRARIDVQTPSQRQMEDHNRFRKDAAAHQSTKDLIVSPPLVWFPCKEVASWINLKRKDPPADAYCRLWKRALVEMSKLDARCLFVSDSTNFATNVL